MCAQAQRRFTQVIHMVVHSKTCATFACRAGRQQRVSVAVLARGGRLAGRDMAWAWVTSPTTAALDARRTPYRTGPLRPRARAASAGPHRRQGSAADYQSATARAGAPAPRRRLCSRRCGIQSCGLALRRSCMGLLPARRLSRLSSPARRGGPGNLALLGRSQIIAAGIPAVVGVAALARCSCRAESGKALHV